jgi:hypothetical protein
MNSFDNYIDQEKQRLISLNEDFPSITKRRIQLHSARNNISSNTSKSKIKNPLDILDISKTNLEFDIQIAALKKKLLTIKEQRTETEKNVNSMKLKIRKLLNEEKESIRELENVKKSILKIQKNRIKNQKRMDLSVNSKNTIKKKNNNDNTIDSSFMEKDTIKNHKFHNISMKKTKFLNKIKSNFDKINTNILKPKHLIKSKRLNRSINNKSAINISKSNDISKDLSDGYIYGINTVRNTSINLGKIILNNNKSNSNINNGNDSKNDNGVTNNNKKILNKYGNNMKKKIKNKKDLKCQIKMNLEIKLKEHENQRKKIQEELKKLEKQQYDLWMNFNDNMNSVDTTFNTNINSKQKMQIKSEIYNINDFDNILNYNFI